MGRGGTEVRVWLPQALNLIPPGVVAGLSRAGGQVRAHAHIEMKAAECSETTELG